MKEYAVDLELSYYPTVFVKANSPDEARDLVMEKMEFMEGYKVLVYGKIKEFENVEFMGVGDVISE